METALAPTNERCPLCRRPVGNGPIVTLGEPGKPEKARLCEDSAGCRREGIRELRLLNKTLGERENEVRELRHTLEIAVGYIPEDTRHQFQSMWGSVST